MVFHCASDAPGPPSCARSVDDEEVGPAATRFLPEIERVVSVVVVRPLPSGAGASACVRIWGGRSHLAWQAVLSQRTYRGHADALLDAALADEAAPIRVRVRGVVGSVVVHGRRALRLGGGLLDHGALLLLVVGGRVGGSHMAIVPTKR